MTLVIKQGVKSVSPNNPTMLMQLTLPNNYYGKKDSRNFYVNTYEDWPLWTESSSKFDILTPYNTDSKISLCPDGYSLRNFYNSSDLDGIPYNFCQ